ncbi:hypothetical protein I2I11_01720 [Pontibacter sp. 172403-2]|uniref:hypothetical protein n=1 Tax=Pontibacter rufus TaxID=2791028 RepID=UPI0018AF594B|nr:hypothetical protein [Pontibacter sp. 172403-2]MBF9252002.1 hypothetical protein [Pontibacter sp. 172403-2]
MRKIISYLVLAGILATGTLESCTMKTPQQKKTAHLKRKSKNGNLPCPCDSN